ncbi:hypothetical protein OG875_12760 [Streptomyces sp. NBC_01498]|uniref:hypothetical protein n=1 Tax=Streptomyces sp. NBC_01498 TaxID=2975870 RepID=UPI002E7C0E64|nr:hypothetical protein [Streptomyces sp. NBC_01498]WTL25384.1 hypothetical protein OG875_12760 [Streptomyces sp. NBC_01498]
MGSMRNPVGPLPSSIYWRRRAIAATLTALLALLVVWVVTSGGDDGGKKRDDGANGDTPAPSITPGPSGSGPAISEQPGGRDEPGDTEGDTGSAGTGGDPGGTDAGADDGGTGDGGSGGTAGSAGAGGTANGGGAGGGVADGASGSTTGERLPAGSALPTCSASALTLKLESRKVAYEPGEKPTFRIVATNGSAKDCKADLGPKSVVLTVTDSESEEIWSSKDCPKTDRLLLKVPAGGTVTRTVVWDLNQSAPRCATPPPGKAGPGTYLVEAAAPGATVKQGQTSIRLDKD